MAVTTVVATSAVSTSAAVDLPGYMCGTAAHAGNFTVCVKAVGVLLPSTTTTTLIPAVVCNAVVEPQVETTLVKNVESTGVGCQVQTLAGQDFGNAPNVFTPGLTSVTQDVQLHGISLQQYEVCVGGDYQTIEGLRGGGDPNVNGGWAVQFCFTTLL